MEKDYAYLEQCVKDYKIIIDTCSIIDAVSTDFWNNIVPILHKHESSIIFPLRCGEELEKHAYDTSKPVLADKSKKSIRIINQLKKEGIIKICGEKNDNFADNAFQTVFTKFRLKHNLLLITQDNKLAKDILSLNNSCSVKSEYTIRVCRVNKYGFLSQFNNVADSKKKSKPEKRGTQLINEDEIFKICKVVTKIDTSVLNVNHIPTEGEIVQTVYGCIRLEKKVAEGGEGAIYTTNTTYIAKIYKRQNNTKRKYEKIKLMLSKKIKCEGICYPLAALYNSSKEFVGYLMPKAQGKELQKSIFIKPLFLKNFPKWKKRDTVELCVTILKKIKYLHDRNIIMGDINPANILVVSPKEVYFVDTDSYQVENFPCPVGTINYTAPEIQRKHFSDFLRTIGNERFAVATLLFMIMLPGKPPYSQQGGDDPITNIVNMDFSYPFGDNSNKKTPDGPWRYIWSHLTYDLKGAFYNTFRKGGDYSCEHNRLSVAEWLSMFENYLWLLDSGKFAVQDKMSEDLFPTRHKKNPKAAYINCKLCGNEVQDNQCKNGICQDCLKKGEMYKCKKCGKDMIYTNYEKYIKKSRRFDICKDCFDYGNEVKYIQTCVDCGTNFEITNNEYDFYLNKGFDIPKRCQSCRDAKRNNYNTGNNYNSCYNNDNYNRGIGSFCFISTVVCEYLGKSDNCIELTTLRRYRDEWLRHQYDGESLISEYYSNAPAIVNKLKQSSYFDLYCQYLWIHYLQPCLVLIENNEYEACKLKYTEMYRYIQHEMEN